MEGRPKIRYVQYAELLQEDQIRRQSVSLVIRFDGYKRITMASKKPDLDLLDREDYAMDIFEFLNQIRIFHHWKIQ